MSMIFLSLLKKVISSRFGQWIIGRVIITSLFCAGTSWLIHKVSIKYHFPINSHVILILGGLLVGSFLFMNFFNIGNFIMKYTLISLTIFAAACAGYIKYKLNIPHFQEITLGVVLTLSFGWGFYKLFNIKGRRFVLKSLVEVDRMGNGHSQDKGRQFEEYVATLYRSIGYDAVTTTELRHKGQLPSSIQKRGGSGDQGVDVMFFDHVHKVRVVVQCKHYSSKVSNGAVQEIVASMPLYEAQRGIVVTNQYFTQPAIDLAMANGIILINRDELGRMIEYVANQKKKIAA